MAEFSKFQTVRRVGIHSLIVLLTLLAAEAVGMLVVLPLMAIDKGYIVIAGLSVLPIWGTLLALVYTADKRLRAIVFLIFTIVIAAVIFVLK